MKNFYRRSRLRLLLACLLIGGGLPSCSDSEEGGNPGYRPDQPIVLESFTPTTGSIATQVIIKGKNFGTDPKALNVYFNEKRAAVISATGERMLVLAPKLPGEECIISVSMGENEENKTQFDEIFNYIIQTNVSTVAGGTKGTTMPTGTTQLSSVASFMDKPDSPIAIDKDDNIYVRFSLSSEENVHRVYMMSEEAGSIKLLNDFGILVTGIILSRDYKSGNVYWWHTNMGNEDFGYFDPVADYASVGSGKTKWDKPLSYTEGMPSWGGRQGFEMNPADGKFYFYSNEGVCARWDPETGQGENLTTEAFKTSQGDIMGIVFDPNDPNIAYFAVRGQHCIYKHDIAAGTVEVWAGRQNMPGYLDGPLTEAQFNNPCQMCVDPEGEAFYVADRENHCIRKIALSNGYVSTFAGTPRTSGYQNGPAGTALFNKPIGLTVNSEGDLYVGDSDNYAVRRIAIE